MIKCCPFCGSHHFNFNGLNFNCNECGRDFSETEYLIEEIRHSMSAKLSRYTEKNPLEFKYPVVLEDEGFFGMSELEKPQIISAFEDGEGIIWFNVEYCNEPIEFDQFDTEMLFALLGAMVVSKN